MPDRFTVATDTFAGPLEALLNLIEGRKMSVSDISLSDVTDAYLAYVEQLPEMPLAETAQFILVASTLLLIKSRTLLPTLELSVEERESVEELERRLARYAAVRNAARLLKKQWGAYPLVLARRAPVRAAVFSPAEATAGTIFESAKRLLRAIPKAEALATAAIAPVLALEDVIKSLHKRLTSSLRTRWSELTHDSASKHDLIVHFLAVLELVRNGSASVTQERLFSDMTIELEALTGAPRYGI